MKFALIVAVAAWFANNWARVSCNTHRCLSLDLLSFPTCSLPQFTLPFECGGLIEIDAVVQYKVISKLF